MRVRNRIRATGGSFEECYSKKRKLKWYAHVYHSSGLTKATVQETANGELRWDTLKKKWGDSINRANRPDSCSIQKSMENKVKWRQIIRLLSKMLRTATGQIMGQEKTS